MTRFLAIGFGLAVAVAGVMPACGGDDTTGSTGTAGSGTAGTGTSGTAGSGSGTAGSGSGTGGAAGSGATTGVGGGFNFDGGFDLDALLGGNYTCADLAACCTKLPANVQSSCNSIVQMNDQPTCSATLSVFKQAGTCP